MRCRREAFEFAAARAELVALDEGGQEFLEEMEANEQMRKRLKCDCPKCSSAPRTSHTGEP